MRYLRPSHSDVAKHAWAILKLLVVRLREGWPKVKITLRADSGFCRWRMLRWCERHGVDYVVVGLAKNPRLLALAGEPMQAAAERFASTRQKQRLFSSLSDVPPLPPGTVRGGSLPRPNTAPKEPIRARS